MAGTFQLSTTSDLISTERVEVIYRGVRVLITVDFRDQLTITATEGDMKVGARDRAYPFVVISGEK